MPLEKRFKNLKMFSHLCFKKVDGLDREIRFGVADHGILWHLVVDVECLCCVGYVATGMVSTLFMSMDSRFQAGRTHDLGCMVEIIFKQLAKFVFCVGHCIFHV